MKKAIWETVTPEELAAKPAHKPHPSHVIQQQYSHEWSRKLAALRGTDRDELSSYYGGRKKHKQ